MRILQSLMVVRGRTACVDVDQLRRSMFAGDRTLSGRDRGQAASQRGCRTIRAREHRSDDASTADAGVDRSR